MSFVISLLFFLIVSLYGQSKETLPNYGYPLLKLGVADLAGCLGTLNSTSPSAIDSNLPPVVDNTADMPPVGDQLTGNSCTGFALTYALGAARNKELGWSLDNQFRCAFLYNLSIFQNGGSLIGAAHVVLQAGCAKLSDFPYVASNWQTLPGYAVLSKAINNSVSNLEWFAVGNYLHRPQGDTTWPGYDAINRARALLAAGKPIVMSIALTSGYGGAMAPENWVYSYAVFGQLPFTGGHALCIVGYNDTMTTRDGQGAFLAINSWGADKFANGYCWITYKLLALTNYPQSFYTFTTHPAAYQPKFKVELQLQDFVNMDHLFYSGFKVGNQVYKKWLWAYRWRNVNYWNGTPLLSQPLPDTSLVDMTDLADYLDKSGRENKFFISGSFCASLFRGTYPKLKALRLVDHTRGIDTLINANITIQDSIFYAEWPFRINGVTSVDEGKELPSTFSLSQNSPNPFNPATTIQFTIPRPGHVSLKVYNPVGEEVAELIDKDVNAGVHNTRFDAGKLNSGIYFYTIHANGFSQTKKMILIK